MPALPGPHIGLRFGHCALEAFSQGPTLGSASADAPSGPVSSQGPASDAPSIETTP
jgi:hypothetical protein